MSPLPELNLNLGLTNNPGSPFYGGNGEESVVVRTDSALKKHTITLVISDQEAGRISIKINDKELEIPTYKLTVTDDKTGETNSYQVTRDTLNFVTSKTRKSFLSFFGFKRFDTNSYLYENIPFEPQVEYLEKFDIPRHRKLSQDALTYEFSNGGQSVLLYAGDLNEFKLPKEISQYFVVADKDQGKSFIGDILYREKFLKLTPKVELQIIKRKKIPKNFEYDDKGHIKKVIYL
ncbi:hypothetical protein [Chryseobacterium aquaticum]|uniref:Uncharacterized protein n=1 Tax=Chryseobacterium aquaticum subsp. greenlandense TaxID=345663 RepID=A0A101CGC1_9FLAO|nr:hypothetical protein [Chryseobacterium aquaticum]KUJ55374.1 hypothetical protein AR686_13440 [Chryseobacterium aquaticum subsp. greenlandense]